MRKTARLPRIIKINELSDFKIFCAFNNGAHRIIDFSGFFEQWKSDKDDFLLQLTDKVTFQQVEIKEGTLQWPKLKKKIHLSNNQEYEVPLALDPLVLWEESEPDNQRSERYLIGQVLKDARKEVGLTQEELAKRSGTTKNYISRIENNKSDIELATLRKIIEIGLNKKLNITIN